MPGGEDDEEEEQEHTYIHKHIHIYKLDKKFLGFIMWRLTRNYTTARKTFFQMFPQTFPNGTSFKINPRTLRKEYRHLQSISHPDLKREANERVEGDGAAEAEEGEDSSMINKAYETLMDPLKRAQYISKVEGGLDLGDDEVGKSLQFQDKEMLMEMMDVHEMLESMSTEREAEEMRSANDRKIEEIVQQLEVCFNVKDWERFAMLAVRLKYCYNIKNVLREWEAGKPINLTH
ncbi:uncharacterized protein C5L36_0E04450 [Pichia kudriavzevii]|uniref:J domain-containing protein n=1 Tax=Pichia kudriavzevii TaxID=4909 RepID=A0A2U9RA71_PICKU|nr:uncharacterized protein C5L36_0E04450 [Pichia kudriavzevii]AWU78390.1 hypothetical protein C5L36_0E04450 [Pichia kudriavzevii]